MAAYNILEARNNLSRLIAAVESGAEVTIMRRGKPVARIVPAEPEAPERPPLGSGRRLAEWFAAHPVPLGGRTSEEVEADIRELREARE
ncbi:type II toxin-antitoxin system Phd/YefM family antitoxin [Microbacterium ulmi]|uniref:Antitoxin n=1 Tax=Microbacterium ulmi TaxID=179095 RepID=A0A7Y2M205_9MICO|nr:type II toxin-antitoxin system prevent-host-death family antitoxin [Microbacterium ulmi]NII69512.1 prevent-host-death family protein [Microbacterium ulmi]NNH05056.1 type II toxin-antitoxin system prevent-host-death family antitoxin [Microbacterium ulmi]